VCGAVQSGEESLDSPGYQSIGPISRVNQATGVVGQSGIPMDRSYFACQPSHRSRWTVWDTNGSVLFRVSTKPQAGRGFARGLAIHEDRKLRLPTDCA